MPIRRRGLWRGSGAKLEDAIGGLRDGEHRSCVSGRQHTGGATLKGQGRKADGQEDFGGAAAKGFDGAVETHRSNHCNGAVRAIPDGVRPVPDGVPAARPRS
jgi:hypothetical protein